MADTDFLNVNAGRSYPLIYPGDSSLDSSVILDAGFVMGLSAVFEHPDDYLYLRKVYREQETIYFDVRSNADGMAGQHFLFSFPVDSTWGDYSVVDASPVEQGDWPQPISSSSSGQAVSPGVEDQDIGFAYLCVGNVELLLETLSSDGTELWTSSQPMFEPAVIQSLYGHYVKSVTLANEPRITADTCVDGSSSSLSQQGSSSSSQPADVVIPTSGESRTGAQVFFAGYNATIDTRDDDNALVLGARLGAGEGLPCEEIPRTPYEELLLAAGYKLDLADRCGDVLFTINGVPPLNSGEFLLEADGSGIIQRSSGQITLAVEVRKSCDNSVVESEF